MDSLRGEYERADRDGDRGNGGLAFEGRLISGHCSPFARACPVDVATSIAQHPPKRRLSARAMGDQAV